jgi:hypothetical protein
VEKGEIIFEAFPDKKSLPDTPPAINGHEFGITAGINLSQRFELRYSAYDFGHISSIISPQIYSKCNFWQNSVYAIYPKYG